MTLSWLLTYALHSTALIGAVWLVARRFPDDPPRFLARVRAALRRHGADPSTP